MTMSGKMRASLRAECNRLVAEALHAAGVS